MYLEQNAREARASVLDGLPSGLSGALAEKPFAFTIQTLRTA